MRILSAASLEKMKEPSITPEDKKMVDQLREEVKDHLTPYYDTDFNLLRWLVGHDHNIELLKPKLINHLMLRKFEEWDLDTLADKPRDHPIHYHWKSGLTGDSVRTPHTIINVEQSGTNDYWGLLATYPTNEILRARVHDLESMLREVMLMEQRTGERCSILYIMDLTGLKMDRRLTTLVSGALASISAFMSEHYVELIHSFVLVNVPTFIHALWTLARPLLPERTKQKVRILGSNWREEILQIADATVLPSYWNDDGKEAFKAHVERGVPFPVENYYKGSMPSESKELIIKAGKTGYIQLEAKQGEHIRYEVAGDGQFAFAVYYAPDADAADPETTKWERVYPLFQKVPGPTIAPLKDNIRCPKSGYFRAWFSNEHAWFHTLKLTHHIIIS